MRFCASKDPIILHADSEDSDQCRQNDYYDNFKVFSSFESSIMAFENIFGSDDFLMNTVLLKILIVCIQIGSVRNRWKFAVAKWIELALKGTALWSMSKKAHALLCLTLCLIFKILSSSLFFLG